MLQSAKLLLNFFTVILLPNGEKEKYGRRMCRHLLTPLFFPSRREEGKGNWRPLYLTRILANLPFFLCLLLLLLLLSLLLLLLLLFFPLLFHLSGSGKEEVISFFSILFFLSGEREKCYVSTRACFP